MDKLIVKIENWKLICSSDSFWIEGNIPGKPKSKVTTAFLKSIDIENRKARSEHFIYILEGDSI
jgi:hypothetical protein